MKHFDDIYALACLHKGGEAAVENSLPRALSADELSVADDAHYLSNMSRRVFRAGLKHAMVDAKWPAFEAQFHHFDPYPCAMMSDDDIDEAMRNAAIIRHRGKIQSIRGNAQFVLEQSREHDGFGRYLAEWPADQTVALWWTLKKSAKQMGGNSGPAFLRLVGKDTFLFTKDVVAVLHNQGVVDKAPTGKGDMLKAQDAFLTWQAQSGRSLCEISRILSYTAT